VVAVADHTKWGTVGLSTFAALAEVDTLVTDVGLPLEIRSAVSEQVREVIIAGDVAVESQPE